MANTELVVDLKRKWWVLPSMTFLNGVYRATGYYPNLEKLVRFYVVHGFVCSIGGKKC